MNHDTIEILGDEQVVTGVKALNKTTDETFDIRQLVSLSQLDTSLMPTFLKILLH
jgi:hypothetical protein